MPEGGGGGREGGGVGILPKKGDMEKRVAHCGMCVQGDEKCMQMHAI
jgi:hypothetical protein